jgi:hypothetical protein
VTRRKHSGVVIKLPLRKAAPRKPPLDAAPRRVKHIKPSKEQIAQLRQDAFALIDFPELLDQPKWKRTALVIAQAFIAQNSYPPLGPRGIAALVDESIDTQLKRGVPLAEAVESARDAYADLLGKKRDAVKRAHQRYGKRGGTKVS